MKTAERIRNVCSIIESRKEQNPVVVVSAVGGITDLLIDTATLAKDGGDVTSAIADIKQRHKDILSELRLDGKLVDGLLTEIEQVIGDIKARLVADTAVMDVVQSFGERLSSVIIAANLVQRGVVAKACVAWDYGMITTPAYGNAEPIPSSFALMKEKIEAVEGIPVITGFIGKDEKGAITTLGRGGSDYTAALYGAALDVSEIQIWTDVDGILSADPRVIPNAKRHTTVSFDEASELAFFGAKVLHPKTILPAVKQCIPVRVLNTFNPSCEGTVITREGARTLDIVKAISCKKDVSIVTIHSTRMLNAHGFLAKVFEVFACNKKSVDIVATSEVSVSMTVDSGESLADILAELNEIAETKVTNGKAIVCVVGEGMKHTKGLAGRIFSTLGKAGINIEVISQGGSEINISMVVDGRDAEKAVKALHGEFFN